MTDTEHTPPSIDREQSESLGHVDRVDIENGRERRIRRWVRPLLLAGLLSLLVAITAHAARRNLDELTIAGNDLAVLDVLYVLALSFVGLVVVPPLVMKPGRIRHALGRLRRRPILAVCSGYVAVLFVLGSTYPVLTPDPLVRPLVSLQPPFWAEVGTEFVPTCHGNVVGGNCQGTFTYPLGTTGGGEDILKMSLYGLNTTLRVAVTASVLAVAMGLVVGTTAGYLDGPVDELLMRYVDLQRSLPSFFLYVLLAVTFEVGYPLMILVFGLFSWGGIARQVRSEVLQRRADAFVKAAQLSGASAWFIIRRHIFPNTSNTVVTVSAVLFAKFVVYEASLAFLSLTNTSIVSLGNQIASAVGRESADLVTPASGPLFDWTQVLWVVLVPAAILCTLLLTVGVLTDGLRDELDPRP